MKRKLVSFVCVLALLWALLPSALGADTMYFTAVNDRMLDYSADTMPVISRGTVYVPYTVFLQSTNGGVDLGVFGSQNRPLNTLSLYGKQKMVLTFDIGAGTAYDMMDNTYTPAIVRNGIIFVPAWTVSNYFDLQYSYLPNDYGALIRIKRQDSYYLDDRFFVASAEDKFRSQKREFDRDQEKESTTAPSPTPSSSPTTVPGTGTDHSKVKVSFAFRVDRGQGPEKLAELLERYGQRGLFFFPADSLSRWDDQIRRLLCQGHKVGVLVEGQDAAVCGEQAEQANRLLGHIARTRTDFLLTDNSAVGAELSGQGWACWQGTIQAVPDSGVRAAAHATALRQQLEASRGGAVRLTMDDSEVSAGALERLLPRLQSDGYTFQSISEATL